MPTSYANGGVEQPTPDSSAIYTTAATNSVDTQDSVALETPTQNQTPLQAAIAADSISQDTTQQDTTSIDSSNTSSRKPFLEDVMKGVGQDSMVYDIASNRLYIYNKGEIKYMNRQMNADYFDMKMAENTILAKGVPSSDPDSVDVVSRAKYVEGDQSYDLDSIVYNINSEKAKIYGIAFKEGEGILRGKDIKKMDNGIFNISGGKYSTCDADHPHFYLALTKAQYVDGERGKKVIVGPSYLVLEDVPLPLFVPFGFFPMSQKRSAGIILPEVGEESSKGFYMRDLGYYVPFGDYVDLTLLGGVYNLGSWELSGSSTYRVRYKYSGSVNLDYSKDIIGTKGTTDYQNMDNYRVTWSHSQDSKYRPGSTLSASVNWSSSNYNRYDATDMSDYVSSQTNSSISYSKTWTGTPFSLSTNIQHSQNNIDSTVMLSMPNISFNVSKFMPFERKVKIGSDKWYEKIGVSYSADMKNSVTTTESELFKEQMFKDMKYGVKHVAQASTSATVFKYFTVTPSITYNERWYFDRISKTWDAEESAIVVADTTRGFYRVYDYTPSISASTRIYGSYNFLGDDPLIKAMRHVISPTVSGSYKPDFGSSFFGFYETVQSNAYGDMTYYSPYENGIYGVPGRGETASISFSLSNTLDAKFRSKKDSTGYKKVTLVEGLGISSSYNFLADSLNLSPFSVTFRTTLFNSFGVNISSTFDPYALDGDGNKIGTYLLKQDGKLARLTALSFSFGYSFRSVFGQEGGTGSSTIPKASTAQQSLFDQQGLTYAEQQAMLLQNYYDFSVPWNLTFNYSFSYSKPSFDPNVTQTLSFNGGISLTEKFAFTFSSGYDFEARSLTTGSISMTRDLHCWQMSFSWVPIGFRKSWSFSIRVKSSMLSDLKYDKSSSYYDYL